MPFLTNVTIFQFQGIQILLFIILTKMQNPRRSSRNLNSCLNTPNIFQNNKANAQLIRLIPESILKKVGKGNSISCSQVSEMPAFLMLESEEEELKKCIRAMEYQLTWHSELLQPQFQMEKPTGIQEKQESMRDQLEMFEVPFSSAREPSINGTGTVWDNRYFLERLNQFLAADPLEAKEVFHTDEFLEK